MMSPPELGVVQLVLDTGERLPCLVNKQTWIPVRLVMRWAMRYRRYRVQASTLASNLRVLGKIYDWAWQVAELDIDARRMPARTEDLPSGPLTFP